MGIFWNLFQPQGQDRERAELTESMHQTQRALNQAYAGFNQAQHSELVESYVYEINALEHRYAYLLQKLRDVENSKETATVN